MSELKTAEINNSLEDRLNAVLEAAGDLDKAHSISRDIDGERKVFDDAFSRLSREEKLNLVLCFSKAQKEVFCFECLFYLARANKSLPELTNAFLAGDYDSLISQLFNDPSNEN